VGGPKLVSNVEILPVFMWQFHVCRATV